MYHLIVMADPEAYDESAITLERGRVLQEYTSESLSERYSHLSEHAVAELKRIPALLAYERANRKDARIGWLSKIQVRRDEARFTYRLDDTFPGIPSEQIDCSETVVTPAFNGGTQWEPSEINFQGTQDRL